MRKLIFDNLALKLLALVLTLVLFLKVNEDQVREHDVTVPVGIGQVPDNVVFTGSLPESLTVHIRGKWTKILRALERKADTYVVDIGKHKDGDMVEFDRAEVERCLGVLGISAMSISPASVTLRMEPRMERVVELEAVTVGEPAVGFFVEPGDVRIQPPKARIAGARSSVEAISAVKTAPVRIDGLNKDLRTETELARIERPFVEVEPKRVAVEVPVREKVIDAEAQVSPVPIQGCMEGMHCFSVPERVLVRLHGPYRAVKAAEPNPAGIVYVDASRYKRSGVFPAVRLRLRAPEGVVVKPEPAVVSFFVEKLGEVQEVIEEGDEQEGENP